MKLFYNTNGFAHHRLEEIVDVLADLGYDGIALTPDVHHLDPLRSSEADVDRFRAKVASRGLAVTIEAGARFVLDPRQKHHPTLLTRDGHAARQAFYVKLIDLAAALGSPLVSIWSGRAEPDTPAGDAALDLLTERLLPVLQHAEHRGVHVCLEPEPGMRVQTLAEYDALRERVEARGARLWLTIDTGHLVVTETAPYDEHVRSRGAWLKNVQLDDAKRGVHEHLVFGDGEVDFVAMRRALEAIQYRDPVSVELSRHSHDAWNVAAKALSALRSYGFGR